MLGSFDNEWTIIEPTSLATSTSTPSSNMASTDNTTAAPATQPEIELPIQTKPTTDGTETKEVAECTGDTGDAGMPRLARENSVESFISFDEEYRRPPPRRPHYVRNRSPIRIRHPVQHVSTQLLDKSSYILEYVNKYDGIADLPFPARGSIYLTTFPYANKDVKKWAWLFSLNIEETFLQEDSRGRRGRDGDLDLDNGEENFPVIRRARNRSPFYDPGTVDLPSVYLSRALDTSIVPEDTANVSYLIVIQNRHRTAGSKLLVADSRKAAGVMIYYEALRGDSTVFVGAAVGFGEKTVHPKKFRKVETLEEAVKAKDEGFVGIVC